MSDPEETAPFTHQPYGQKSDENPFVSPSGPAAQPSGPSYVQPSVPPPPTVPYGQPGYQQAWPPGWGPAYAGPYPGSQDHKGAKTALVLGIISVASLVTALLCCVTLPGVLCAPFAWFVGARAKREIERAPGVYGNLGSAVTGMWMGAVTSVLGFLAIAGFVALAVWIGYTDYSLV